MTVTLFSGTSYDGEELTSFATSKSHRSFEERLITFKNWKGVVSPKALAAAGLFYVQSKDICKCPYCHVEIYKWKEGDCPIEDHYKFSKNCAYAQVMWDCKMFGTKLLDEDKKELRVSQKQLQWDSNWFWYILLWTVIINIAIKLL